MYNGYFVLPGGWFLLSPFFFEINCIFIWWFKFTLVHLYNKTNKDMQQRELIHLTLRTMAKLAAAIPGYRASYSPSGRDLIVEKVDGSESSICYHNGHRYVFGGDNIFIFAGLKQRAAELVPEIKYAN